MDNRFFLILILRPTEDAAAREADKRLQERDRKEETKTTTDLLLRKS
jgi:hypothetical protein